MDNLILITALLAICAYLLIKTLSLKAIRKAVVAAWLEVTTRTTEFDKIEDILYADFCISTLCKHSIFDLINTCLVCSGDMMNFSLKNICIDVVSKKSHVVYIARSEIDGDFH